MVTARAGGATRPWQTLVALVWVFAVSDVFMQVVPFLLGAMVERFGVSEGVVSLVVATEIVTSSATAAAVSAFLERLELRVVAAAGLVAIFAGDVIAATTGSFAVLVASRILSGFGEGCCLSSALVVAARTPSPDRTFAVVLVGVTAIAIAILVAIPPLAAAYGAAGSFWAMATMACLAAPSLVWLRPAARDMARRELHTSAISSDGMRVLACSFLAFLSFNVLWLYVERLGLAAGLTLAGVAEITMLSALVALAGPAMALWLAGRSGRSVPFTVALLVEIVSGVVLMYGLSAAAYAVTNFAIAILFLFVIAFFRGVTAELDASGRLAAASGAAATLSGAAAPALGGVILLLGGGYPGIGWLAAAASLTALIVVRPVLVRLDRATSREARLGRAYSGA